jgi:hypothetical protein
MMRCAKMARPGPRTIKRPQYNLAGAFLNGGWQRIGFALFAIGDDFLGILLQAIVVQNIVICGRVVVAAQEKPYEILVCWRVSQPIPASDLVHVQLDLSRGWR